MSGEDYVERIELVMLEKCQLKSCMTVATLEDGTADHSKVFKVILSRASLLGSRIQLERNEVIVTINDNDGKSILCVFCTL